MAARAGKDKNKGEPAAAPAPAAPALAVVGGTAAPSAPAIGKLTRQDRTRQRLTHISRMRPIMAEIEAAQALVKAKKKLLKEHRDAYVRDGYILATLDEALEDQGKPRKDRVRYEVERTEVREDLGQAVNIQPDMLERMPDEEAERKHWNEVGYADALAQKQSGQYPKEMAERFKPDYTKGFTSGDEVLKWALAEKGVNPERDAAKAAAVGVSAPQLEPEPDEEEEDDGSPEALKASAAAREELNELG